MLNLLMICFMSSILSLALIMISKFLNKKTYSTTNTLTPFECGISSVFISTAPVSLRFFILAVIFLIFDVELILLFPILLDTLQFFMLNKIYYFLFILSIVSWGLLWEWNQTLLTWSQ